MENLNVPTCILAAILCAVVFSGNAQGSSYNSQVQALYSPALIDAIIKEQKEKHGNHTELSYSSISESRDCPIDGPEDTIQISQVRTSLPDEYGYVVMPKKERYGR